MDKYIKQIQSRLKYKGFVATKQQCRDAYQTVVVNSNAPAEEEINLVIENLIQQQADSALTLQAPAVIKVAAEEPPSIWETLQPPADNPAKTEVDEEVNRLSLTVSNDQAALTTASSPGEGITPQQIQDAVEHRFADRPNEIKAQVVQYATQSTFGSAKELEQMLEQLRQVELSVMLQIINTHNTQRLQTLVAFRDALGGADTKRKEESQAFFAQFSQELEQMKAAFGV